MTSANVLSKLTPEAWEWLVEIAVNNFEDLVEECFVGQYEWLDDEMPDASWEYLDNVDGQETVIQALLDSLVTDLCIAWDDNGKEYDEITLLYIEMFNKKFTT